MSGGRGGLVLFAVRCGVLFHGSDLLLAVRRTGHDRVVRRALLRQRVGACAGAGVQPVHTPSVHHKLAQTILQIRFDPLRQIRKRQRKSVWRERQHALSRAQNNTQTQKQARQYVAVPSGVL